ncbi:MAG: hypothetical protein AAGD18_05750 [Actinomycetota bacterium]
MPEAGSSDGASPVIQVVVAAADHEFDDLRRRLAKQLEQDAPTPLEVLDVPPTSGAPPSTGDRLAAARRADLLLVLLGTAYDDAPQGYQRPIARLQYDAVLSSAHATLLAVTVDTGLDAGPEIDAWRTLIVGRTRTDRFASEDPELLDRLAERVWAAAHSRQVALGLLPEPGGPGNTPPLPLPGEVQAALGAIDGDDPYGDRLEDLGPRIPVDRTAPSGPAAAAPGGSAASTGPPTEPARLAAEEQWREAVLAWQTGRWSELAHHLGRGDDERPLDAHTALFRARIGLAAGRIDRAVKAIPLADRAAALATGTGKDHLAAAAMLVASRAARAAGADPTQYVERALTLAPDRAEPLVEQAIVLAEAGRSTEVPALIAAAAERYPGALIGLAGEPAIQGAGPALVEGIDEARARARAHVEPLCELALAVVPSSWAAARPAADLPFLDLVRHGQAAAAHVFEELRRWAKVLMGIHQSAVYVEQAQPFADMAPLRPDPPFHRVGIAATIGLGASLLVARAVDSDYLAYFGTWALVATTERSLQERIERDAQYHSASAKRLDAAQSFRHHIDRFEQLVGAWPCLAPVAELERAAVGDVVLVPSAAPPAGLPLQTELFPPDLAVVTGPEPPPSPQILVRVMEDGEGSRSLSRVSAYFGDTGVMPVPAGPPAPSRRRSRR